MRHVAIGNGVLQAAQFLQELQSERGNAQTETFDEGEISSSVSCQFEVFLTLQHKERGGRTRSSCKRLGLTKELQDTHLEKLCILLVWIGDGL